MGGQVALAVLVCTAALLAVPAIADATFTIVHFNDVHSRLEPADASFVLSCTPLGNGTVGDCYGGFGKLKTIADRARAWGPTLLLDIGDEFVGTLYSHYYRGTEAYIMQNMIGVDAMTLGNHEFDYGPTILKDYIKNLTFPVVTCNVVPTSASELFGVLTPGGKAIDLELANGTSVKVGLVGWTTTDKSVTLHPLPDVELLPLVSSVQACVDDLQSKGINIIIGLGHAGAHYGDGDYEVAANVKGIDVVLGAHSHTLFYNGVPPLEADSAGLGGPYPYMIPSVVSPGQSVPYVQVLTNNRYVGVMNVSFDEQGNLVGLVGNPVFLSNSVPFVGADGQIVEPVPADQEIVAKTVELGGPGSPLAEFKNKVVGSTAVPLITRDLTGNIVSKEETNLGNLITDAMLWEIKKNTNLESLYGPIDIAFENGGGIRAPIPAGDITVNQVLTVLPFEHGVTIKNLSGWALMQTLEKSVTSYPSSFGGFLQMAGLAVLWDSAAPAGRRIVSANLLDYAPNGKGTNCLGAEIENSNSSFHLVASNEFIMNGGDGYTAMGQAPYVSKAGRVLSDILSEYIATFNPIAPKVEGRIRRFNSARTSIPHPTICSAPPCFLSPTYQGCTQPEETCTLPNAQPACSF